jgi:hypothetical protein
MNRKVIRVLRVLVVITLLVALFGQTVVVPGVASEESQLHLELAYLAVPYAVLAVLVVACVQVALVAVWMLLSMVQRDAIFTERAFRWVDVVIGSAVVATVLAAGVSAHLSVMEDPTDECASVLPDTLAGTFTGVAFVLLMGVVRGLLRKATTLESELSEVI